jgi:hypothetical protein
MRSSKSRSRSKANRPRSLGNIVNRVFDSSGPEGKVRGTPQQIIDKYLVLARDAQLSNDRVAAENFLQHAEHYTRMLGEAQREMQREADARNGSGGGGGGNDARPQQQPQHRPRDEARGGRGEDNQRGGDAVAVIDFYDAGPALVETPEARGGRGEVEALPDAAPAEAQVAQAPETGETKPAPRRRAPRRPRGGAREADGTEPSSSAAE